IGGDARRLAGIPLAGSRLVEQVGGSRPVLRDVGVGRDRRHGAAVGLTGAEGFLYGVQGVFGRIGGFPWDIRHFDRRLVVTPDTCSPKRRHFRAAPRARELSEPAKANMLYDAGRLILSAWHCERNRLDSDFFIIV